MNKKRVILCIVGACILTAVVTSVILCSILGKNDSKEHGSNMLDISSTDNFIKEAELNIFGTVHDSVLTELQSRNSAITDIHSYGYNYLNDIVYLYIYDNNNTSYIVKCNKDGSNVTITDGDYNKETPHRIFTAEDIESSIESDIDEDDTLDISDYTTEEIVNDKDLWFTLMYDWLLTEVRVIDDTVTSLTCLEHGLEKGNGYNYLYFVSDAGRPFFAMYDFSGDYMAVTDSYGFDIPYADTNSELLAEEYRGLSESPEEIDEFLDENYWHEGEEKSPEELIQEEIASLTDWSVGDIPSAISANQKTIEDKVWYDYPYAGMWYIPASFKEEVDSYIIYCMVDGIVRRCKFSKDFSSCEYYEIGKYKDYVEMDYLCQNQDILFNCFYDSILSSINLNVSDVKIIRVTEYEYRGYEEAYLQVGTDVNLTWADVTFKDGKMSVHTRKYGSDL